MSGDFEHQFVVVGDLVRSAKQCEAVVEKLAEIAHGVGRLSGSREDEETVEDPGEPPALVDHDVEQPATGLVDAAHRAEHLGGSGDRSQGILDLVRHPRRHLAGRGHSVPHPVAFGFDAEFGQILEVDDETDHGRRSSLSGSTERPRRALDRSRVPSIRGMEWLRARLAMRPQLCSASGITVLEGLTDLIVDVGDAENRGPGGVDVEGLALEVGGENARAHRSNHVLGQRDELSRALGFLLEHRSGPVATRMVR